MKKFVYWVGVYTICITIHDCIWTVNRTLREKEKNYNQRKESIGITPEPAKKPINRIGFEIPQA